MHSRLERDEPSGMWFIIDRRVDTPCLVNTRRSALPRAWTSPASALSLRSVLHGTAEPFRNRTVTHRWFYLYDPAASALSVSFGATQPLWLRRACCANIFHLITGRSIERGCCPRPRNLRNSCAFFSRSRPLRNLIDDGLRTRNAE